MTVLLGAEAAGLGALFFGLFEHEAAVRAAFGVPEVLASASGTIALGVTPTRTSDAGPSAARRGRPPFDDVVHRGRWLRIRNWSAGRCRRGLPARHATTIRGRSDSR